MCSPSHARRPESACSSGQKKTPVFLPEDACVSTKRRLCLYPKDACVSVRRRLCLYRKTGVFFRAARETGCGTPRTRRDAPTVGAVDLDPAFASKRRERAALTRLEALLPNAWGRPGQRLGRGREDERTPRLYSFNSSESLQLIRKK